MDARSPGAPTGLMGWELQTGLATEFVRPGAKENQNALFNMRISRYSLGGSHGLEAPLAGGPAHCPLQP